MKALVHVSLLLTLVSSAASGQTPTGQEVNVTVGGYTYIEPGDTSISIHGPKIGGEYSCDDDAQRAAPLVCPG